MKKMKDVYPKNLQTKGYLLSLIDERGWGKMQKFAYHEQKPRKWRSS